VYQSMQGTNVAAAELSYRVRGELAVVGQPPVRIAGLMSQSDFNSGAINAALLVGEKFNRVYENALDQPVVSGLKLRVEAMSERRTALVESARVNKTEARAGDMMEVEATLRPYQAEAKVVGAVPVACRFAAGCDAHCGQRRSYLRQSAGRTRGATRGRAGGYHRAVEPEPCERCYLRNVAGQVGAGGAGVRCPREYPAFDGECDGAAERCAADAVDRRERGGGGIGYGGLRGERVAGADCDDSVDPGSRGH
jgi:hypothetical protein